MISRIPIYVLFIAASLVLGLSIPGFYRWTGSDQSRPSPLIGQFALGMTLGGVALGLMLPFLPIRPLPPATTSDQPRVRFNLRSLLLLTTGSALAIVGLMKFPLLVSSLLCGAAFIYFIRFVALNSRHRWPAAALLACMYLPLAWVFDYEELDRVWLSILWTIGSLPMLLPAAYVSSWVGQNFHQASWIGILMTSAELLAGTWLISLGTKRTLAYLILAMLVSVFGSFCLHAMVLA